MASREHEIHIDADCDATRTLLIIGNGFDLYHDLATKYSDYRNWLVGHDKQVVKDFDSFVYAVECSDFENSLDCTRGSARKIILDGALLKNHSALNGTTFVMKLSITRIQI